jgi:hypothetical protein
VLVRDVNMTFQNAKGLTLKKKLSEAPQKPAETFA